MKITLSSVEFFVQLPGGPLDDLEPLHRDVEVEVLTFDGHRVPAHVENGEEKKLLTCKIHFLNCLSSGTSGDLTNIWLL